MTQIVECGRTVAGDVVAFDIQWDGDLPSGAVAWSARISNHDGEQVRLVHQRTDSGSQQYVEADAGRRDVEVDADVRDDDVIVRFPAEMVGVASEWPNWLAVLTVDGEDVAQQAIPLRG